MCQGKWGHIELILCPVQPSLFKIFINEVTLFNSLCKTPTCLSLGKKTCHFKSPSLLSSSQMSWTRTVYVWHTVWFIALTITLYSDKAGKSVRRKLMLILLDFFCVWEADCKKAEKLILTIWNKLCWKNLKTALWTYGKTELKSIKIL